MVLLLADRVEQINYYCSLKCSLLGEKRSNEVYVSVLMKRTYCAKTFLDMFTTIEAKMLNTS
jgi:hypothetical protein